MFSALQRKVIDVAIVSIKVLHHQQVVAAAVEGGKSVYCEWPLGNGLAEAVELARLAREKKTLGVVGTQAVVSPEAEFWRELVVDGYIGDVPSSTYLRSGFTSGDEGTGGGSYGMGPAIWPTLPSVS